jgi:hypothetical protein
MTDRWYKTGFPKSGAEPDAPDGCLRIANMGSLKTSKGPDRNGPVRSALFRLIPANTPYSAFLRGGVEHGMSSAVREIQKGRFSVSKGKQSVALCRLMSPCVALCRLAKKNLFYAT